jgi:hypothetical protein
VLDYRLDIRGLIPGRGKRYFFASHCPDWLMYPPVSYAKGTGVFSPGIK